jgi:acyl carrier protein
MGRDELRATVLAALTRIAPDVDPASLDPGDDLREQCELDSMDFLSFVERLHDATGADIPERDYPRLASVDLAVEYLAARPS